MTTVAPWRLPPFVPGIRVLRITWRLLPALVVSGLAILAALVLSAPQEVRRQVLVACAFVLAWALLRALTREVLSPVRSALRFVPLSDTEAHRIEGAVRLLLACLLVTELGAWLVRANPAPQVIAGLLGMGRAGAIFVFVWATLAYVRVGPRAWALRERGVVGSTVAIAVRILLPLALLTGLAQIVVLGLGYRPLAAWIAQSAAWTGAKVVAVAWAYRFVLGALRKAVSTGAAEVAPTPAAVGILRVGGGLVRLATLVGGGLWILAGWGLAPSDLAALLDTPVLSGGSHTWSDALRGLLLAGGTLFVGWLVRQTLTFFVFPALRLDVGARYALLAVVRYLVGILALVFTFTALGLEASSLAWFLGAAGIGLGLGLQDVLGNFFSGLVMLVERPIRVGDAVAVGDTLGIVEAIRIRGTLIRTPDNTTVIVPNRQMLGERITNLSFRRDHARITLRVGVAYDSDPDHVRAILLSVARSHPEVLSDPPPRVQFTEFGASDLVFTLFAHSHNLTRVLDVASELRFALLAALRRAGIVIPFPQQDVHLHRHDGA